MSGDFAVQVGRDALLMVMLVSAPMLGLGFTCWHTSQYFSGNDVDTGADTSVHTQDYCHFCGHSTVWSMDSQYAGGLYPYHFSNSAANGSLIRWKVWTYSTCYKTN